MKAALSLGDPWTLDDLSKIGRGDARLAFMDPARSRVARSHQIVARLCDAQDQAPRVYGLNTGFGALAETRIASGDIKTLQLNLVRSHACGVGPELPRATVRAMIALRAQTLSLGFSGVRPILIERLMDLLHQDVLPRIPAQGSVGASGDLAPLAHLALVLVGEGEAYYGGRLLPGAEALGAAGLEPLELEAKEGLALINGTQMMVAIGGLAVHEGLRVSVDADIVGAMSLEALQGSHRPFDERIHLARGHLGQKVSARNLLLLLEKSQIMESHRNCGRVQDPYSLRCMPQVHGAARDTLGWARQILEREINAATDNPLIFVEGESFELISGGNFHGQPVAVACDAAAIAIASLANISERRIEQLVNPAYSSGLPPFLAPRSGLDSGFMMAQVTAAALVSENKILSHPASVDSIPSSAGKEDHVSMGSIASRKLAQIVDHTNTVLAIEALVAAQGLDLRLPHLPGHGVLAAHKAIRTVISKLDRDRTLYPDIQRCGDFLREGSLRAAAESAVGPLS